MRGDLCIQEASVVCPSGLLPLPACCDRTAAGWGDLQESSLLKQFKDCCQRADKLLTLLSLSGAQDSQACKQDVLLLFEEALSAIQRSLKEAALAPQPLLLTSSQHTSCFCQLLDHLQLLQYAVDAEPGAGFQLAGEPAAGQEVEQLQRQRTGNQSNSNLLAPHKFGACLEQQLQDIPGLDTVLAKLIAYCQSNASEASRLARSTQTTGSSKHELVDVTCLSSLLEQNTATRALPLLLRLYFNHSSRAEAIAAGKPEALKPKDLEQCLGILAAKPIVPGFGDMPVCVTAGLGACEGLQEVLAARKLKLPPHPAQSDAKSVFQLDQSYSLSSMVAPLLQQHNELCDLLSQLALEAKQAGAVDRDLDYKVPKQAECLVVGGINFVLAAKNALLDLDAWRAAQSSGWPADMHGSEEQQHQLASDQAAQALQNNLLDGTCNRCHLTAGDIVPFMVVLSAMKGLSGLLTDSNGWLQPLLQDHAIRQLQYLAERTLPALAKQYSRSQRVQELLKASYACLQGQLTELEDSFSMGQGEFSGGAGLEQGHQRQQHHESGPVGEGIEVLLSRLKPKARTGTASAHHQQRRHGGIEQQVDSFNSGIAGPQWQGSSSVSAHAAAVHEGVSNRDAAAVPVQLNPGQKWPSTHASDSMQSEHMEEGSNADSAAEAAQPNELDQQHQCLAAALIAASGSGASKARSKKGWGKSRMCKLHRGGEGRPQPSPLPALSAAPAAINAQPDADMGPMHQQEVERSQFASTSSLATVPAAAGEDLTRVCARRLSAGLSHTGSRVFEDLATAQSGFSSISSLSTAFERPPDLPWEHNDTGSGQDFAPGSVAATAAAFESRIAASRLAGSANASRLSAVTTKEVVLEQDSGAMVAEPDLQLSAAAMTALDAAGGSGKHLMQVTASEGQHLGGLAYSDDKDYGSAAAEPEKQRDKEFEPPTSPHSAADKLFGMFRFKSLQQHHEKLSGGQAAAEPEQDGFEDATAQHGAAARINAVFSKICRRSSTGQEAVAQSATPLVHLSAAGTTVHAVAFAAADAGNAVTHPADEQPTTASQTAADGGAVSTSSVRTPRVTEPGSEAADVPTLAHAYSGLGDQPAKSSIRSMMSRVMSMPFRPGQVEQQAGAGRASANGEGSAAAGPASTFPQGLKALKLTTKLKKALADRRQASFVDGITLVQIVELPSRACLIQLRVLLEQLMYEIKTDTMNKLNALKQLQQVAVAAASAASSKPDAAIVKPLKQVKAVIKAVHDVQLILDYPQQLAAAADLSGLWLNKSLGSYFSQQQAAKDFVYKAEKQLHLQQQLGGPQQLQQQPPTGNLQLEQRAGSAGQDDEAIIQSEVLFSVDAVENSGAHKGLSTVGSLDVASQAPEEGTPSKVLYSLLFDEQSEGGASPTGGSEGHPVQTQLQAEEASCAAPTEASRVGSILNSFPLALVSSCMSQLQHLPAELPLLALQLFWDARALLQGCGMIQQALPLLQQQEEVCVQSYMQRLVPTAYEHFKRLAAHQTVTYELLHCCKAALLQPVQPFYFDALLGEPYPVVLQGDYTATAAAAAEAGLSAPGAILWQSSADAAATGAAGRHLTALQQQVLAQLSDMLYSLQQQESPADQLGNHKHPADDGTALHDDQLPKTGWQAAAVAASVQVSNKKAGQHLPERNDRSRRSSPMMRHRLHKHTADNSGRADVDSSGTPEAVGQTPLMLKIDQLSTLRLVNSQKQAQQLQAFVSKHYCSVVDLREWLLAGFLGHLKQDVAQVVSAGRSLPPSSAIQIQVQAAILQRTHELVAQYAPLVCSWSQVWEQADAVLGLQSDDQTCQSATVHSVTASMLGMLDSATYDNEARVLLPRSMEQISAAVGPADGVLQELASALKPFNAFFGRQHIHALHALAGPAAMQHMAAGLLAKLDQEQITLLKQMEQLQRRLPSSLQQLPPADQCHDAGAVLQFYQQSLSAALSDPMACSAALGSLQRFGNCLGLLHLMSVQLSAHATPVFMQVAPLLGIVGSPLTEAAVATQCIEHEESPAALIDGVTGVCSPSCTPGLLMPEVQPTNSAHALQGLGAALARHKEQQPSHFERMLLGPDADKVNGPALLLTQSAELQAWKATNGVDYWGPCLAQVQGWANRLQQQLQRQQHNKGARAVPQMANQAGWHASSGKHQQFAQSEESVCKQGGMSTVQAMQFAGQIMQTDKCSPPITPAAIIHQQLLEQQPAADNITQQQKQHVKHAGPAAPALRDTAAAKKSVQAAVDALAVAGCAQQPSAEPVEEASEQSKQPQQDSHLSNSISGSPVQSQPLAVAGEGPNAGQAEVNRSADIILQPAPEPTPVSTLTLTRTAPAQLSAKDLNATAAAAFTAAAATTAPSTPTSPLAEAAVQHVPAALAGLRSASSEPTTAMVSDRASGAVSPWQAANEIAANLSPGAVAPAHVKLAYKALVDPQQQHDSLAESVLGPAFVSSSSIVGKYGLGELVAEMSSDAMLTARSEAGSSLVRPLSGRQIQLQLPADLSAAAASRRTSYHSSDSVTATSHIEAVLPHQQQDDEQQQQWHQDNLTSGDFVGVDVPGNVTVPVASPSCVMVPPLGLSSITRGAAGMPPLQVAAEHDDDEASAVVQDAAMAAGTEAAAEDTVGSTRGINATTDGSAEDRHFVAAAEGSSCHEGIGSEASENTAYMQYPAPAVDDLEQSNVFELLRTKDENNVLRGQLEMVRNELQNTQAQVALLTGSNIYTPRIAAGGQPELNPSHSQLSLDVLELPAAVVGHTGSVPAADAALLPAQAETSARAVDAVYATHLPSAAASDMKQEVPQESMRPQLDSSDTGLNPSDTSSPNDSGSDHASSVPSSSSNCGDISSDGERHDSSQHSKGNNSNHNRQQDNAATHKIRLPSVVPNGPDGNGQPAQLATVLSMLKFALLLDVAQSASSFGTAADSSVRQQQAQQRQPAAYSDSSAVLATPRADTSPTSSSLKRLKHAVASGIATAATAVGASPGADNAAGGDSIGASPVAASLGQADTGADRTIAASAATEQPGQPGLRGSGRIAGGHYGDGPLLAAAVLLQLSGQSRRHALLDATSRIAHWVEYDAVKQSTGASAGSSAEGPEGGVGSLPAGLPSAGGIGSEVKGIAPPKPCSKRRQEEEAKQEAKFREQQAAQQVLLQRLAAASRQASQVEADGTSLAARFAPPAAANSQKVQLKAYRMYKAAALTQVGSSPRSTSSTAKLQRDAVSKETHVRAVPVKPVVLDFAPMPRPWSSWQPCQVAIKGHPNLPMPRPQPLLLPNATAVPRASSIGAAAMQPGNDLELTGIHRTISTAASATGGGKLQSGAGVTPNAGLVAAARAVHARDALIAALPRTAVYSFSVVSDYNRSGRPDDGYSKAPSTGDLESIAPEDFSPRKGGRQHSAAAVRLGGRRLGAAQSGDYSGSEEGRSSPARSLSRSPSKRQQWAAQGGLVGSLAGAGSMLAGLVG